MPTEAESPCTKKVCSTDDSDALINFVPVLTLAHEPFSYCIIDQFLHDKNTDQFCRQLTNELSNVKLNQKNNDLYKFQQVARNLNASPPNRSVALSLA